MKKIIASALVGAAALIGINVGTVSTASATELVPVWEFVQRKIWLEQRHKHNTFYINIVRNHLGLYATDANGLWWGHVVQMLHEINKLKAAAAATSAPVTVNTVEGVTATVHGNNVTLTLQEGYGHLGDYLAQAILVVEAQGYSSADYDYTPADYTIDISRNIYEANRGQLRETYVDVTVDHGVQNWNANQFYSADMLYKVVNGKHTNAVTPGSDEAGCNFIFGCDVGGLDLRPSIKINGYAYDMPVITADSAAEFIQEYSAAVAHIAFNAGYDSGYADGYEDGYKEGYADGYDDGWNDALDALNN